MQNDDVIGAIALYESSCRAVVASADGPDRSFGLISIENKFKWVEQFRLLRISLNMHEIEIVTEEQAARRAGRAKPHGD